MKMPRSFEDSAATAGTESVCEHLALRIGPSGKPSQLHTFPDLEFGNEALPGYRALHHLLQLVEPIGHALLSLVEQGSRSDTIA